MVGNHPPTRLVHPSADLGLFSSFGSSRQRPLVGEDHASITQKYAAMQENFERFYARVTEGQLLAALGGLTSQRSFMDQALGRVRDQANFSTMFANLLHGAHTYHSIGVVHLPWLTLFLDHFVSQPIPENLEAIASAKDTIAPLDRIIGADRQFYDRVRGGVRPGTINGQSVCVGDLEVTFLGDDKLAEPRMISPESSSIQVDGRTFYNGLPGDRSRYPTVLLPEGSSVTVSIKNTSSDKLYGVMPTFNGLPIDIESLGFVFPDFKHSNFPVYHVQPQLRYVKPGETLTFDHVSVGRFVLSASSRDSTYPMDIGGDDLVELAHLYKPTFMGLMSDTDRTSLEGYPQPAQDIILFKSLMGSLHSFLYSLLGAKKAKISIGNPVVADSLKSSELPNPFLGSLGLAVLQASQPPVKANHDFQVLDSYMLGGGSGGITRGIGGGDSMGVAGLANLNLGSDRAGTRRDFWETLQYDTMIHEFKGYAPINVLALK